MRENFVENLPNLDVPQTWPAIESMVIDDENRIWVSTIVPDFDIYEWWVLTARGELLAQFRWPRIQTVEEVKNDKLYALESDTTTGLKKVVRYDIEFE